MSCRAVIHPDLVSTCRKLRAKNPARYEQLKKRYDSWLKTRNRVNLSIPRSGASGGFISDILSCFT